MFVGVYVLEVLRKYSLLVHFKQIIKMDSIKLWAADDRPREKMMLKGAASLSDSELLAILITNGSKDKSALDIAKEVLHLGKNNLHSLGKLSVKDLQKIKGI